MNNPERINWLLDNGGPVIRYRTMAELAEGCPASEKEALLRAVLQTEKTRWLLDHMDGFEPITHMDIRVLNSLHGMKPTCLENIIPRLLERGLRTGVKTFDEKMGRFRQYVDNPLVNRALDGARRPTIEDGRAVFVAVVMASYFLRGGYQHEAIIRFVKRRIELLSRLAAEKNYSIHLSGKELNGLPAQWNGRPIIRPEFSPTDGEKPLPLIHDLYAMAYFPVKYQTDPLRRQMTDIAAYVTDDRYRALPPGYGFLWLETNRRMCYACGWNLDLPALDSANPYEQRKIVQRLELLARFPTVHGSSWFQKAVRLLEGYRTERGTFCFPASYLAEMKTGYYVGGEYMGLEDDRRNAKVWELESTFRMTRLQKFIS